MEIKTSKGTYCIDYNINLDIVTIFNVEVEHDQSFEYVGYLHIGGEKEINDIYNIRNYVDLIREHERKKHVDKTVEKLIKAHKEMEV